MVCSTRPCAGRCRRPRARLRACLATLLLPTFVRFDSERNQGSRSGTIRFERWSVFARTPPGGCLHSSTSLVLLLPALDCRKLSDAGDIGDRFRCHKALQYAITSPEETVVQCTCRGKGCGFGVTQIETTELSGRIHAMRVMHQSGSTVYSRVVKTRHYASARRGRHDR